MQELEKILEEIDELRGKVGSECTSEDHYIKRAWEHCLDRVEYIIRKRMNDGWIPVKEGTPEPYQQVLVSMYNNLTYVTIGHYDGKGWNVREYITDLGVDVKAWRPLPQPYRPGRSVEK